MAMNMIERTFYEEVREKKIAGRGIFSATGKGKKHGTQVTLPSDYLSAREKRNLNGKVVRHSMYQSLMSLKDFQRNPEHMQQLVMEKWREHHSNKDIYTALGIPRWQFFELLDKLGVTKKKKKKERKAMTTQMTEGIPTYEEFQTLDKAEQKEMLQLLREEFPTEAIKKVWGMSTGGFYSLIGKLGLPTQRNNKNAIRINMAAQLGSLDILEYKKFKNIALEQQAELFDNYKKRFATYAELASAWGIATNTIYGIASRLSKVSYTPTPKEDIIMAKPMQEEPKQVVPEVKIQREEAEQETLLLQEVKEETTIPADTVSIGFVEPEEEQPEAKQEDTSSQQLKEMIEKLAELVLVQDKRIQDLQMKVVEDKAIAKAPPTEPKASPTEGFTMNYEKTCEGFMAHMDIKRFISVLEKNPDQFKISISITKIDE